PGPAPTAPPPGHRQGRRALFVFWVLALIALLAAAPGRMAFDTKLGVALDPLGFLGDLGELWQDRGGFGTLSDQYAGYLFPMLPYYALTDLIGLPVWFAERLWLSLILTTAFWGALRLAERLGVGTARTRPAGALVYALWPTFTIVIGSTSAAALPGALLPWVLLPLTSTASPARVAAARSALLIPCMGGVNAASTLASLLPVGLYLLSRPAGPRKRALIAWWLPGVVLATAWWVVPLLLLGIHGEDFMPYVEQSETTTATMSATELLRGAGNWVAYLHFGEPWLTAGWTVAASVVTVLCSAFAAALGLAGLARRDLPERRWLVTTVVVVLAIALAGYGGALGAPFHETVRDWFNGPIKPFRSVYKFQTGLALTLALGLAHLTAVAARRRGARAAAPGRRWLPLAAALLVLPGLAWPYLNGGILQPGAFKDLPNHWRATADWLRQNASDNRALVVPATAHGVHTWGTTVDQPLDVLAESRWAQRDYVPFGTPGSRRAMDAVEEALRSGGEVPGLRDFLARAGLHHVVVRNDLDPEQIGYAPPRTVRRALELSGYRKVAGFGPAQTGGRILADTPLQVQAIYPRPQAVEIYEPVPDGGPPRPGPVALRPTAGTAVVGGGPEALLRLAADPAWRDRPAVLAGDNHPGVGTPALRATADGLRRADTRFGLIDANTSYTYTATERNGPGSLQDPGRPPRQILPTRGIGHQTTAVLDGARSVTASSSGNWLFHLPQYDPVNAFDGNPDTAWAEGSAGSPVGQWLRIDFTEPRALPARLRVTPLPGGATRAAPTVVRVENDRQAVESPLRPDGTPQMVRAPAGTSPWLRITVRQALPGPPGLSGAGFSEIEIPGVRVARVLKLPDDVRTGSPAPAEVISLHRGTDASGLSPVSAETGLLRQIRTAAGDHRVRARAVAVPGPELDRLLDRVAPGKRNRVVASADSVSRTGIGLSARNLVDGDLTTAWIAGDRPVIHLRWPGKREIGEIVFVAAGGISTRPREVRIASPDGAATAGVDGNGRARFDPITTDQLTITISDAAPLTVHNPLADGRLQLPVGLSEVYVPALADLRVPAPASDERFRLPCGEGPALAIGDTLHTTAVSGSVRALTERRPVDVELCAGEARDGTVALAAGEHRVKAGDGGPLAITDVTLTRGAEPVATSASATGSVSGSVSGAGRSVAVRDWRGDRRTVTVGAGEAAYLQTYENADKGWKATLDGKELSPLRLDGWQQAWLIPAGAGGVVRLEYEPARIYEAGLVAGAAGVALVIALAAVRGGGRRRPEPWPERGPAPRGRLLALVAITLVMAVVAGPFAIVVPLLALLGRFVPRALPPIALAAMAAAGVAAAVGAGAPPAHATGAFGPAAQALALLAVTAAITPPLTPAKRVETPPGERPHA
ncbi:alpha-(1-_3)-arabinofuranosyltransferase domain-containing protein, partial [Streptomyces sp. URMC 123]|uniref:alpha-(1->3)-arabinofuranosyltransferase domain-containing protein n=1 Tax=Streptomyces sp. URMC 123 TaxID=3423403 RepID=UPI003F1D72EF